MLLLALSIPAPVAQARITPADVPAVLEAIVEDMATDVHPGWLEGPVGNRPFFVDAESLAAFQEVAPGLARLPAEGARFRVVRSEQVRRCAAKCEIEGDGILLTVVNIRPGKRPGESRVRVDARFASQARDDLPRMFILTISKRDGQWAVVDGMVASD